MSKAPTKAATKQGSDSGNDTGKPKVTAKKAAASDDGGGGGDDDSSGGGDDDDKKKKKTPAKASGADDGGDDDSGGGDDDQGGGADDDDAGGDDDSGGGDDEDWRAQMAGGDEKFLARLTRFASLADVGRSLQAAEKAARAKGGVQPPAADAPVEEKAKFYTEHFGRPAKVEDLRVEPTLPDGEEFQDEEVTLLQGVMGLAHQAGVFGQEQLDVMAQMVTDLVVGGRRELGSRVKATQQKTKAALEKVWGKKDFQANLNYANAYAAMRCEQAGVEPGALAELRLQDGSRLGDNELYARVMALGGRDHAEDPNMNRDESGGSVTDLHAELKKEMGLMNGTPAERKEYATPAAAERRKRLREAIKRGGGKKPGK